MQGKCAPRCGEALLVLLLLGLREASLLPVQGRPPAFLQPRAGTPVVGGLLRLLLMWGEEDTAGGLDAMRGRLLRLSFPGPDQYRRAIEGDKTAPGDGTQDHWEGLQPSRIFPRHVDGFFTHRYSKLLGEEAARHALRALLAGPRRYEVADDGSQRQVPLKRETLGTWDDDEDASEGDERQQQGEGGHHNGRPKSPQQHRSRAQLRLQYLKGARLEQAFMTPLQY